MLLTFKKNIKLIISFLVGILITTILISTFDDIQDKLGIKKQIKQNQKEETQITNKIDSIQENRIRVIVDVLNQKERINKIERLLTNNNIIPDANVRQAKLYLEKFLYEN